MGAMLPLLVEREIRLAGSRHPKEAPVTTSRECPRDRAHGGGDCHSNEGKAKRRSSVAGRPSGGISERELQQDQTILLELHQRSTLSWRKRKVPQEWKDAILIVLHTGGDKTECGNHRGISLVAYAGKVLLKVCTRRLSAYCEAKRLLPEEQRGYRPGRSTTDMMFVVHRLQDIGWKAGVYLFTCFSPEGIRHRPSAAPSCGRYSLASEYHRK